MNKPSTDAQVPDAQATTEKASLEAKLSWLQDLRSNVALRKQQAQCDLDAEKQRKFVAETEVPVESRRDAPSAQGGSCDSVWSGSLCDTSAWRDTLCASAASVVPLSCTPELELTSQIQTLTISPILQSAFGSCSDVGTCETPLEICDSGQCDSPCEELENDELDYERLSAQWAIGKSPAQLESLEQIEQLLASEATTTRQNLQTFQQKTGDTTSPPSTLAVDPPRWVART